MRWKAIIVLAGVVMASSAGAGPFGIDQGHPLSAYKIVKPGRIAGIYQVIAPQPNVEFESYWVISTPEDGVCKVWGAGTTYDNDAYGSGSRAAYSRLSSALDAKYGQHKEFDFLRENALWKDDNEWVMSLTQHERTKETFWDREQGAGLPDDIGSIDLEVKGLSRDAAFVELTYEFSNFPKCQAHLQQKANSSL